MIRIHHILIVLLFFSCQREDKLSEKTLTALAVDHGVPAWAYLGWENGKISQHFYFGYRSLTDSIKVTEDTYFEGASLSKTVFAALVLDYFRKNKLSPDSVLEIKGLRNKSKNERDGRIKTAKDYAALFKSLTPDQRKQITAKNILTHMAGFGDWMNPALNLDTLVFLYSGEGFLYLQRWLEERENKQLDSIEGFQFMNSKAMDFSLGSAEKNVIWGHDLNREAVRPIWYSPYPYVHGTLCCKPKAFADWWLGYLEKPDSLLLLPQTDLVNFNQRTTGMGLFSVGPYQLLWQHGNDTYFQNLFIHDKNSNSGFVVFTNSQNGFEFINEILGEKYNDIGLAVSSAGLFLMKE